MISSFLPLGIFYLTVRLTNRPDHKPESQPAAVFQRRWFWLMPQHRLVRFGDWRAVVGHADDGCFTTPIHHPDVRSIALIVSDGILQEFLEGLGDAVDCRDLAWRSDLKVNVGIGIFTPI